MERLDAIGDKPGWIYKHRAIPLSQSEIQIFGGKIATLGADGEIDSVNDNVFILDIDALEWRSAQS